MQISPPNYTQVPNVIFDYWMSHLTPAEFKVLLCVCRKTFGWHKEKDAISLKQIERMTGLSRKGIIQIIKNLLSHDLLIKIKSKTQDGDDAANQYEINVTCMGVGSELSTLGVVNSGNQGGSVLSTPTKERPETKETLKSIAQTSKSGLAPVASQIYFDFENRSFKNVQERDIQEWVSAYPAIDPNSELPKMVQWILSNEKKSKSKKHWRKFITNWLSKGNDEKINSEARSQAKVSQNANPVKEANLETFRAICKHLVGVGRKPEISLRGNYVYHTTGDSVSLELQSETFTQSLCSWCKLKVSM